MRRKTPSKYMIVPFKEQSTHWYKRDVTAFYEVDRADGQGKRSANLADARKVGAVPSVSNVIAVKAKPALEAYKGEQLILAALTMPRITGETEQDFARRLVEDADSYSRSAMDLGTAVHAACDAYAVNRYAPTDPQVIPLFDPFRKWFDENVETVGATEKIYVHQTEGYGGRIDLIAKLKGNGWAVVDFKTQRMKQLKGGAWKCNCYEEWPLQLEAYRRMIVEGSDFNPPDKVVSLVINTAAPSECHVQAWEPDQYDNYWRVFLACFEIWRYQKNYDPRVTK